MLDDRTREAFVWRYVRALDTGAAHELDAALDASLQDPELDRLIGEINLAYAEEHTLVPEGAAADLVRGLLRQHFPSSFQVVSTEPLTVADVARQVASDKRLTTADHEVLRQLTTTPAPLPDTLPIEALRQLANELKIVASDRFWRAFKDAAVTLRLRRGALATGQWALARETRPRTSTFNAQISERAAVAPEAIATAVAQVWAQAKIDPEQTSGLVSLRPLLDEFDITLWEERPLTYERAAGMLQERIGSHLQTMGDGHRRLSGFLYAQHDAGLILVHRDDAIVRRRFTIAHELGHFLLHRGSGDGVLAEGVCDNDFGQDDQPHSGLRVSLQPETGAPPQFVAAGDDTTVARLEREANQFAADLLMPATLCRRLFTQYCPVFGARPTTLAQRIASDLMVSPAAMTYRLRALELVAE